MTYASYSIKTNVWSLGIIFYQMLYGSLPWMNPNSVMQWFKAINEEKLTFPNTNQVSEEMKDLIIVFDSVRLENALS